MRSHQMIEIDNTTDKNHTEPHCDKMLTERSGVVEHGNLLFQTHPKISMTAQAGHFNSCLLALK